MKFKVDNLEIEIEGENNASYEQLKDGTISIVDVERGAEIGIKAPFTTLGAKRGAIDGLSCDVIIGNYVYRFMHLDECKLNRPGQFHRSGNIMLGSIGSSGMTKGRVMLRIQVIFLGRLKKDVNVVGITRRTRKSSSSRTELKNNKGGTPVAIASSQLKVDSTESVRGLHRQANMLINALRSAGYPDNSIATITGVMAGESGLYFLTEKPWSADNLINMKHGKAWGGIKPSSYPTMRRNLSRYTDEEIRRQAKDPKWSFNIMYAGNNGNGNFESGDGYKFRGRGPVQLTGRNNYEKFAAWMGDYSIVRDPDTAFKRDDVNVKSVLWYLERGKGSKYYTALKKGAPVSVKELASAVVGGDGNFRVREIAAREVANLMAVV